MSLPQLSTLLDHLGLGLLRLHLFVVGAREHEGELRVGTGAREHHLGALIVAVGDHLSGLFGLIFGVLQVMSRRRIALGAALAGAPPGGRAPNRGFTWLGIAAV